MQTNPAVEQSKFVESVR